MCKTEHRTVAYDKYDLSINHLYLAAFTVNCWLHFIYAKRKHFLEGKLISYRCENRLAEWVCLFVIFYMCVYFLFGFDGVFFVCLGCLFFGCGLLLWFVCSFVCFLLLFKFSYILDRKTEFYALHSNILGHQSKQEYLVHPPMLLCNSTFCITGIEYIQQQRCEIMLQVSTFRK